MTRKPNIVSLGPPRRRYALDFSGQGEARTKEDLTKIRRRWTREHPPCAVWCLLRLVTGRGYTMEDIWARCKRRGRHSRHMARLRITIPKQAIAIGKGRIGRMPRRRA